MVIHRFETTRRLLLTSRALSAVQVLQQQAAGQVRQEGHSCESGLPLTLSALSFLCCIGSFA